MFLKGEGMAKNTDLIFEKIIDTALECIFWKDCDRKYVGVNKAFLNYFGLDSEDDLIGKNDEEMGWLTDVDTFVSDEVKVLDGETVYMRHAILIIKGEKRDIMISKAPIYDNDKIAGLAGSLVDVTEEKRKEREIEELRKNLEKSLRNEKKEKRRTDELIARLRLEMKNPLSAIYSISYMDRYATDPDKLSFDMRRVHAASNYLMTLSQELIDIRSIENDNLILEEKECAFEMIIDGIETVIRPLAEEKGLKFLVSRDYDRKKRLVCDPGRVQQIAINLLMNSIRFTDEGKITFDVKAEDTETDGKSLKVFFRVKDDGCGIGESFIPKIYDEFSQEKRNPNKYGKGTGLGLTVVKRLVDLLNGNIEVDSEEDMGTTFRVEFEL